MTLDSLNFKKFRFLSLICPCQCHRTKNKRKKKNCEIYCYLSIEYIQKEKENIKSPARKWTKRQLFDIRNKCGTITMWMNGEWLSSFIHKLNVTKGKIHAFFLLFWTWFVNNICWGASLMLFLNIKLKYRDFILKSIPNLMCETAGDF